MKLYLQKNYTFVYAESKVPLSLCLKAINMFKNTHSITVKVNNKKSITLSESHTLFEDSNIVITINKIGTNHIVLGMEEK